MTIIIIFCVADFLLLSLWVTVCDFKLHIFKDNFIYLKVKRNFDCLRLPEAALLVKKDGLVLLEKEM